MQIYLPAYYSLDQESFDQHKTCYFAYSDKTEVSFQKLLEVKSFLKSKPELPKKRYIQPSLTGSEFVQGMRADLVISDSPSDIYGAIDKEFAMRHFKLDEIKTLALDILGKDYDSVQSWNWESIYSTSNTNSPNYVSSQERARLFATPLMKLCQKERTSEENLLGFKKLTWEKFAENYISFVEYNQIILVPREQVKSLAFGIKSRDQFDSQAFLIIDEDKVWGVNQEFLNNPWSVDKDKSKTFPLNNVSAIEKWLQDSCNSQSLFVDNLNPSLSFYSAPSLFKKISLSNYYPTRNFGLPEIQKLAKDLNVSAASTKTKSELTILLGERIVEEPPVSSEPLLIFSSLSGGRPDLVEDLHHKHPLIANAKNYSAKEYFLFASRIISQSVYAPLVPASPAGRIPTDGNFPSIYAIKPIDIFE